jgi:hypothetical protein
MPGHRIAVDNRTGQWLDLQTGIKGLGYRVRVSARKLSELVQYSIRTQIDCCASTDNNNYNKDDDKIFFPDFCWGQLATVSVFPFRLKHVNRFQYELNRRIDPSRRQKTDSGDEMQYCNSSSYNNFYWNLDFQWLLARKTTCSLKTPMTLRCTGRSKMPSSGLWLQSLGVLTGVFHTIRRSWPPTQNMPHSRGKTPEKGTLVHFLAFVHAFAILLEGKEQKNDLNET